jgi:4'-phosphopantetheinyl transferase
MKLYYFENFKEMYPELKGSELTNQLILDALNEYGVEAADIKRTETGKPYVDENVHFSVSHSGDHFVCLVCDENVGVDIQLKKSANIDKLSRRYFSSDEIQYIEKYGEDGFFKLWARKEAYCKFTGNGLKDILSKVQVLERKDIEFIDFELEEGLYCSCCMTK